MSKAIFIWIGVFAVTFGVLFFLINASQPADSDEIFAITKTIRPTDNIRGNAAAPVVVMEYGDFQCPGCAGMEPLLKRLQQELGDQQVAIVYRNFTLPSHPHAIPAAQIAEAAALQGKYWEMHDAIFAGQESWKNLREAMSTFMQYARDLGLDVKKLEADLQSEAVQNKLAADRADTVELKLDSTPTLYVNGKRIRPNTYEELKSSVESAARS